MTRKLFTALLLGLSTTLAAGAAAADALGDFAAQAPIELQGNGPYYRLALPFEVHWAAHFSDLRDLRVFNGQGQAVPYSLIREKPRSEQTVEQIAVAWFPLYVSETTSGALPELRVERRADGTVVSVSGGESKGEHVPRLRGYLLDLSQSRNPARRLTLDWDPAVAGFQRLTVEASDDLQHWQTWRSEVDLARLDFNGQHVERRDIELGDRRAAYLRLGWHEPAVAPALTSVTLTTASASDHPAPFVWSEALAPTRASEGEYEWQFPEPLAPERLKIALAQTNVLAPAELWAKDDLETKSPWRLIGRAVLYRLRVDGRDWEQEEIALAGQPVRLIKLKPDARSGGLGGAAPTLSLGLTARQLLFLAQGDGPFVLALGDDKAAAAGLAPATLVPGYDTGAAPPVSPAALGSFARMAAANATSHELQLTPNWKTLTLWAILLTGVAAIAAMALYLLRQMRK